MANRSWAVILLAILLIVWGAVQVVHLSFEALPIILGIIAIIDGILWLVGK